MADGEVSAVIRKPIITVLGHVDSGKTKLLDAIRGTTIAEKEAGGITQHIGATEVPIGVIMKTSGELIEKYKFMIGIPGLLFIDTPGHEAFTNLRKRGGSIADLAVLVIDINEGLQMQTHEAIDILRAYKTPFIIAANKIDRLRGWHSNAGMVSRGIETQPQDALEALDTKIYELVGAMHTKGFSCERFDRVRDFTKEVPIIPVSAKTKEGIPELLMFLAGLSQKYLEARLKVAESGPAKGTVLELKEERGLGKTIDVILYDGKLKVGEEIVLGGQDGIITTRIRALLTPKPMEEIRQPSEKFRNAEEVHAACGVKIAAPMLDKALAGSPLRAKSSEGIEEIRSEIARVTFDLNVLGPIVRADALGSLEAVVKLLSDRGLSVKKADIGEVGRKDVMEAETVMARDRYAGVIFAFNVHVDEAARKEAKKQGVKIFEEGVVYRLLEAYEAWVEEGKAREKEEKTAGIVMPAELRVMPNCIFRNTKPAIVGVKVVCGRLRPNTELMKDGRVVGRVEQIQDNGKNLAEAKERDEVAVSIKGATVGRNLFENDELYSVIPRRQLERMGEFADMLSEGEMMLMEKIKTMEERGAVLHMEKTRTTGEKTEATEGCA